MIRKYKINAEEFRFLLCHVFTDAPCIILVQCGHIVVLRVVTTAKSIKLSCDMAHLICITMTPTYSRTAQGDNIMTIRVIGTAHHSRKEYSDEIDGIKGANLLLKVGDMKLKVHAEGATIKAPGKH